MSSQDERTTLVAFFKKTVVSLENIRATWKAHSFRDNDMCVVAIKQISAGAKTTQRQNSSVPNSRRQNGSAK